MTCRARGVPKSGHEEWEPANRCAGDDMSFDAAAGGVSWQPLVYALSFGIVPRRWLVQAFHHPGDAHKPRCESSSGCPAMPRHPNPTRR